MGAVAFILASVGLIGGFGLIAVGNKKIKPITFPNDFYKDLRYFKNEDSYVIAVKEDGSAEVIFEGTRKSAAQYFNQVQLGFENWLKENDKTSTEDNGGSVKFE